MGKISINKTQGVCFHKPGKFMIKVYLEKYRDDTCQEYFE